MAVENIQYPAQLEIDYPAKLNRVTTFFRVILAIPVFIILSLLAGTGLGWYADDNGQGLVQTGSVLGGLLLATGLMILFRQAYPRWWFDFNLELNKFSMRVGAYLLLLTDRYPSTIDEQSVHLTLQYPDAKKNLNRWLPLVKWLLAFPHYIVLIVLGVAVGFTTIVAWFAILFTGNYPRSLFNFAVGVNRWSLRVSAYSQLLITDKYPPFSLK
jgi:hypothetical protein